MTICAVVREITWLPFTTHGWGCGYVGVDKDHPWYGQDYESIDADVHGGLTFGSKFSNVAFEVISGEYKEDLWFVGFDTAHFGDGSNWPKDRVISETLSLMSQAKKVRV